MRAQIAIQALDGHLMPFGLDVAIGVGGLADASVPELPLNPPDVRAALEQPGRKGMPRRVIWPVGDRLDVAT